MILFHNQIQFPNAFEKACPMNYSILIDRELQKKCHVGGDIRWRKDRVRSKVRIVRVNSGVLVCSRRGGENG